MNIFASVYEVLKRYKSTIFISTVMLIFMGLTMVGILHHEPWFDEAQAWLIAQDLNFWELLNHMKYEGHMFLWFLALMPTAKLHLAYPLPMQLTNIIFAWGAVYILLKKCPLHPILKVLITFSFPIAYQYSVIARPYAMGIFFLFLLAALYKDKLKYPILYAVLIFLCANTSTMALGGAIAFGGIFIYDYICISSRISKEKLPDYKRNLIAILSIALFCVFILGFQLLGANKQIGLNADYYLYAENPIIFAFKSIYHGIFLRELEGLPACIQSLLVILTAIVVFWKDKKTLFFFVLNYVILTSIFIFAYNGYAWHHYFLYIYLIVSLWIFDKSKISTKLGYYLLTGFLAVVAGLSITSTALWYQEDFYDEYSISKSVADKIISDEKYKNANLVTCDELTFSIVPYLQNKDIKSYNCIGNKENLFFNRKYNSPLQINSMLINPEHFSKFEDKDIYLIFYQGRYTKLKNDYYKWDFDYCSGQDMMFIQFCIMKLIKDY